ncbi:TIGR01777 family protein [Haloechinothrix sp. YIM 98757]|uniref:TIGR01777 family protein n=1 Tax=Haloechinothrix aidingensis TaxID=2752311 RepID=A0A838A6Q6_9PSEU|nr:TIGR01777 family oxidoreductase [Haloechinothrix aidingensis]MBA0125580.1 TIGR01777 family protein [Haloechinothrix aidingensis]
MRILIAGSSGFIGSALVDELRRAGHEVLRLVRREPAAEDERHWDPPRGTLADGALDGVDAVVNLCGSSLLGRWSAARKQMIRNSRIEPTEVLAEAVAERGVPVLVNASGIGYYGDTAGVAVDESRGPGEGFMAQLCVEWERATGPAREAGTRVVSVRTGLVLAGHGGLLRLLRPVFLLALGGRLGSGAQYMSWISLSDEVAAIRFAVEHGSVSGPLNLCAPSPVTNREFTRALARQVNRPAPWTVPAPVLRVALGEAAEETALISQRVLPAALSSAGFEFAHTELDTALGDLL